LQASYVRVVEDRPILSAECRLPLLAKTNPPCSAVSAIAELLVIISVVLNRYTIHKISDNLCVICISECTLTSVYVSSASLWLSTINRYHQ